MTPSSSNPVEQAAGWLRRSRHVAVFTGAGISAESGIPTFRDDSGLWQRFPPEHYATWSGLIKTAVKAPRDLAEFVAEVLGPIAAARPNKGHLAVARLDEFVRTTVITQNVDGLHQDAGSKDVWEIHGTLLQIASLRGRLRGEISRERLQRTVDRLRGCQRGLFPLSRILLALRSIMGLGLRGIYRPRVVMFGDSLAEPDWTRARSVALDCDVMLVVGTSSLVQPAAFLPIEAATSGAKVILVDRERSIDADVWLRGSAAHVLPELVDKAFGG